MKTFKKFVLALTLVCVFNFFIFLYDIKSKNLNHYKSKKSFKKNKIKISLMHIPKTSGTSFNQLYKSKVDFARQSPGPDEKSFSFLKKYDSDYKIVTFFRNPIDHVFSQYLECRFDEWGKSVTKGTLFPRNRKEDYFKGDTPDFDSWLQHFKNDPFTTDNFNCYNPKNIQTRYLQTQSIENPHNFLFDSIEFNEIGKQRIKSMIFFGLQDYFLLSTCLFDTTVLEIFDEKKCDCTQKKTSKNDLVRITHGVPPHSTSVLKKKTKDLIDLFVQEDQKLFSFAKRIFFFRVQKVEKELNINFCGY